MTVVFLFHLLSSNSVSLCRYSACSSQTFSTAFCRLPRPLDRGFVCSCDLLWLVCGHECKGLHFWHLSSQLRVKAVLLRKVLKTLVETKLMELNHADHVRARDKVQEQVRCPLCNWCQMRTDDLLSQPGGRKLKGELFTSLKTRQRQQKRKDYDKKG